MNDSFRAKFPSLKRQIKGKSCVFLDGPAGTQVPESVIRAISQYYRRSNANTHGVFATTRETDKIMDETRSIISTFLGADGPHNISFGQNMTTLNYSLSRAIGRILQAGDEIVITQLDHESNRGPWLSLRQSGIIVREVKILKNGTLDYSDFKSQINERTRLVCMGLASNISGAVNDVSIIRKLTYEKGAMLLIDAVHYAPHFRIDVSSIECDFLLCSAYKFYGPHIGILYSKTGLLDQLPTDRLRTTYQHAPYSIETGTLNHAAIAGVKAAIQFIAGMGSGGDLKTQLDSALEEIGRHEGRLLKMICNGLGAHPKIKIIGPEISMKPRAPTISFIHRDYPAIEICRHLAHENIFAWSGHFYAIKAAEVLGLMAKGGVTRIGLSAYSDKSDVARMLETLGRLK